MASVAEKTYTHKELIDLYIKLPERKKFHPNFDAYYTGLGAALDQLFDIEMFKDEVRKNQKFRTFIMWPIAELFDDIVCHLRSGGIGSGWLEGGPLHSLDKLAKESLEREITVKTFWDANHQEKVLYETYRSLLYQLFDILYGKTELVLTSKDLLTLGFDDSREPNISDYWEYV